MSKRIAQYLKSSFLRKMPRISSTCSSFLYPFKYWVALCDLSKSRIRYGVSISNYVPKRCKMSYNGYTCAPLFLIAPFLNAFLFLPSHWRDWCKRAHFLQTPFFLHLSNSLFSFGVHNVVASMHQFTDRHVIHFMVSYNYMWTLLKFLSIHCIYFKLLSFHLFSFCCPYLVWTAKLLG